LSVVDNNSAVARGNCILVSSVLSVCAARPDKEAHRTWAPGRL
jgi:hypothetical protein